MEEVERSRRSPFHAASPLPEFATIQTPAQPLEGVPIDSYLYI